MSARSHTLGDCIKASSSRCSFGVRLSRLAIKSVRRSLSRPSFRTRAMLIGRQRGSAKLGRTFCGSSTIVISVSFHVLSVGPVSAGAQAPEPVEVEVFANAPRDTVFQHPLHISPPSLFQ